MRLKVNTLYKHQWTGILRTQTRYLKEPKDEPENYHPEHREIQPEDSSLLQTKLLEKPLVTDKLTCNLENKTSRKVLSCCSTQRAEVKYKDHLGCCQLLCFCDSPTCPSVLTYSSGGMLFSGCPTCNVKKSHSLSPSDTTDQVNASASAICALLVTDFSPCPLILAKAKRV